MVNIVVGDNACGKTKFLRSLIKNTPLFETNIKEYSSQTITSLDESRLQKLRDFYLIDELECDEDNIVVIRYCDGYESHVAKRDFVNIVEKICNNAEIVILDDPELDINAEADIILLRHILSECSEGLAEIWLTTHCPGLTFIDNAKFWTVKDDKLLAIREADVYEFIN